MFSILIPIAIVVAGLAVCGTIAAIAINISRKVKRFQRDMFGTTDMKKAARDIANDVANTPKSVSAMTNMLLPQITRDFPNFGFDEMKQRALSALQGWLRAITKDDVQELTTGSEELKTKLSDYIQNLRNIEQKEHFDNVKIHRTEISNYVKRDGRCIVTFQSALQCMHYITNWEGKTVAGDREYKYQTKFDVDLIYVQDSSKVKKVSDAVLGINCPNCGAVITSLGQMHCEYCGTAIVEVNKHVWTVGDIREITSASMKKHEN